MTTVYAHSGKESAPAAVIFGSQCTEARVSRRVGAIPVPRQRAPGESRATGAQTDERYRKTDESSLDAADLVRA